MRECSGVENGRCEGAAGEMERTHYKKPASSYRAPGATGRRLRPRPVGEGSERSAAACYERRQITGAEGPTSVVSKQTGRKQLLIVLVLMRQQWRAGEKKAALIAANKVTVTITRRGLANTDEESLLCGAQVC